MAFTWLARHVTGPRVLDVRIPDTIVLYGGDVWWLRASKPTGLIPHPYTYRVHALPTPASRWKRQLKREVCPDLSKPLSQWTRAQVLTPVAMVRTVGPGNARTAPALACDLPWGV